MEKTILYPFLTSNDNKDSYIKTLNLAVRKKAKVVCFTVIPDDFSKDEAYLHLLKLNGCYQTEINNWCPLDVKVERAVKQGILEKEMNQYLKEHSVDMIICQEEIDDISGISFLKKLLLNQKHQPDLVRLESERIEKNN